jgi:DNA mismatch repair ATPase MutS
MANIKTHIEQQGGFKFMTDELVFSSPVGRKKLMHRQFYTNAFELKMELNIQEAVCEFATKHRDTAVMAQLIEQLCHVNDISNSVVNLVNGNVLDDIQLFEVKKFSLISDKVSKLLTENGFDWIPFHDLTVVIDTLDPDKNRLPQFHIYSSYKPELAEIRQKIDQCTDADEIEKLKWEESQMEDKIRTVLSKRLSIKALQIQQNLDQIGYLDLLLAHAEQILKWQLCKPTIIEANSNSTGCCSCSAEDKHSTSTDPDQNKNLEGNSKFIGLFNPLVKHSTGNFQAIDIELHHTPTLITGANMSGKTVLLKTIGLAQTMCQFGFFVPATKAEIALVDDILFSIGDKQSEMNGLSSFAVEILNIDKIIKAVKEGQQILALVDELARTTNPEEGKALVSSFIQIMQQYQVDALITTHYSGLQGDCRRLRVKGLKIKNNEKNITPENINQYMDYSLVETTEDNVPMEAISIAEIFGIDEELTAQAKRLLHIN